MPNAPIHEPVPRPGLPPLRRDNPLRGIAMIIASGVFMTAADVVSKILAGDGVPAPQITWLRYCAFFAIMALIVARLGLPALATRRPWLQFWRGVAMAGSSLAFVSSLFYLPIADATATTFVTPLFVTALSIPLLGETIGWRRWVATAVGFVGVLIVVRPGGSGFQIAGLLPLLSAMIWALGLIATRMMSATESPIATLSYSAVVGLVLMSAVQPFIWQWPSPSTVALGILVGLLALVGHWLVILAFRYGDASVLAPFTYVQLVFTTIFGYLVFAVLPDLWTVTGSLIIAGSGLYTAHRERVRRRQLAAGS